MAAIDERSTISIHHLLDVIVFHCRTTSRPYCHFEYRTAIELYNECIDAQYFCILISLTSNYMFINTSFFRKSIFIYLFGEYRNISVLLSSN